MDDRMNWRAEEEICWDGPLIDELFRVLPQIDAAKVKLDQIEKSKNPNYFRPFPH